MVCFPFDVTEFDELDDRDRENAMIAASAAEKFAGYCQDYARALYFNTAKPDKPSLTIDEILLVIEFTGQREQLFRPAQTRAAQAALKLLFAAQADFYQANPRLISVFGKNVSILPWIARTMTDGMNTYPPVDQYFQQALDKITTLVEDYLRGNPPPSPSP